MLEGLTLALDLLRERGHLVEDPLPILIVGGTPQIAVRIGEARFERPQHAGRRLEPQQVIAQPLDPLVERPVEFDRLPRIEPEGHLDAALHANRNDRLLILQRARPLVLADRVGMDAVGGQQEDETLAGADALNNLLVPRVAWTQPMTILLELVQPDRDGRVTPLEGHCELLGDVEGIDRGVADEVMWQRAAII